MEQLRQDAALLEAALRQGLSSDHESLRGLLARRPAWAELLTEASDTRGASPELLERVRAAEQTGDGRLVDEFLALARTRPAPRSLARIRRLRWLWAAAAAAGVLLAAAVTWSLASGERARNADVELLGEDEPGSAEDERIVLLAPLGRVERYGIFQWSSASALASDESYLLILRELQADGTPGVELRRMTTRSSTWEPDALDLVDLPSRLHWSVQRVSPSDSGLRSEAWVERSPR
jgi:hypothetical protein